LRKLAKFSLLGGLVRVVVTVHALRRLRERGGEEAVSRLKEMLEDGTLLLRERAGRILYIHYFPFYFVLGRSKHKPDTYFLVTVLSGIPYGLWRKGLTLKRRASPFKRVKIVFPRHR